MVVSFADRDGDRGMRTGVFEHQLLGDGAYGVGRFRRIARVL